MEREQQIDIVAQAIRNAFGARSTDRPYAKPRAWDQLPDQVREDFRNEARAAINAYEATQNSG